ncbi:MAG TPA: hypothetical protein VFA18_11490, partial [Gemmataceae bacterium]|nr:hypothetical protein [Gemmataceae bacterium]
DSNNNPVTSGLALEPVVLTPATPAISTTQQPATVTAGGTVADQATVTGGLNPTGTVTFRLYSSPTVQNATTLLFTDTETLVAGVATSKAYTTVTAGTDYWVATYNGNANNVAVSSLPTAEPVVIKQAIPNLAVKKTSPFTSVWQGSEIYYAIVVTNVGPTTVTSFSLFETLPAGLLNPVFAPLKGTYNPVTHVWSGLNLAPGQHVGMTLYVQVSLTATGTLTNVVQVGNSVSSYSLAVLALSKRFFI